MPRKMIKKIKINKMKKLSLILGLILFSCTNPEEVTVTPVEVDSILVKSQKNLITSDSVQKKSDSTTKEQVIKVIREFKILTNEVDRFKTERVQLMSLQNVNTEKVIYRIDTVYIEVEKNFWGKKKTTTSVKSDSSVSQNIDTSLSNEIKIDTTKNN
jgi:hypothetical protein